MINKFFIDVNKPKVPYSIPDDLHSQKLKNYYFDFDETEIKKGKHQALLKSFDKNGIPLNESYIDVENHGYVYYPITIGQYGLAVFHTYLKTKSANDKNRFLKFVDWFYHNVELDNLLGVRWLTHVQLPQYKHPGPWQSAFSQSRGISILLRGYQLVYENKYAEIAEKALTPFTKPLSEGGVTSFTKWGSFYEEYPAEIPTLVLNGMIFSICGVYDFVRVFPEHQLAKNLFDEGIKTLKNILPEYDLGFWSRYNLCRADWYPEIDPATIGYQRLHINQLEMLFRLTGDEIFKNYAELFKKQDTLINALKMYKLKYKSLKKIGRL